MIQEIAEALAQSWHNFATAFVLFVPRLIAATIIFSVGFVLSILVRRSVRRLLAWLRCDRLAQRIGASEMLRVADMPSAEQLVAKIVFWIVWIGFIVSAVDTLQFGPFQGLVDGFFRFVPRFLVALLMLALGFLIGNFVWRATLLASVERGAARRATPQQRAAPDGHRDRGRDGARTSRAGNHGRADRVCHHLRRRDAGPGDRIRAGRTGRRQESDRTTLQGTAET